MPNPETTSDDAHVPSHGCIRLEDPSHGRTASIDAEWDALASTTARESVLPIVSARPHFETLPGLGPESHRVGGFESQPATAARRPRRPALLVSILAAALAIAAVFVWRNSSVFFALPTLTPSVHSNLVALASSPSPTPLVADVAQPLPSVHIALPETRAPLGKAEAALAKPARKNKPMPRAVLPVARVATQSPAPRFSATDHYRSGQALASTDNPY